MDTNELARTNQELEQLSLPLLLTWAVHQFPGEVALASSLGPEDQVLLDAAAEAGLLSGAHPLEVFTLDTGRLFPETLELLAESEAKYAVRFRVYCPDTAMVEAMVAEGGINSFRHSVEERHHCCHVRKVLPLERALVGKKLWIVGLRSEQSASRSGLVPLVWDGSHGLLKLSPLVHWSEAKVTAYLNEHGVPRSPLHARGYPSVGCAPCTRAVSPGEDPRSGRWWWEQESHRECGLHLENGRLVRNP